MNTIVLDFDPNEIIAEGSQQISSSMFGTNMLSGYESGDGQVGGETFDDVINSVFVQQGQNGSQEPLTIRFPGGTITEESLANQSIPLTIETPIGEQHSNDIPMSTSEFLIFCAENSLDAQIVLPTFRYYPSAPVSDTSDLQVNEDELYAYVTSILETAYATGVTITSFEIGNEWWSDNATGTALTPEQYGQIAAIEAEIIQVAIDDFYGSLVEADLPPPINEPSILVQIGTGENADVETGEILAQFQTEEQRAAVDGFVTHRYPSVSPSYIGDPWVENKIYLTDEIEAYTSAPGWKSPSQLTLVVSEWNLSPKLGVSGVESANYTIQLFGELVENGVDSANFWSTEDRSQYSLTLHTGGNFEDEEFLGLSFSGEAIRMLSQSTIGAFYVDLQDVTASGSVIWSNGTHYDESTFAVSAFVADDTLTVFISNNTDVTQTFNLDMSTTIEGGDYVWATVLTGSDTALTEVTGEVPILQTITDEKIEFEDGVIQNFALDGDATVRFTFTIGDGIPVIFGYTADDSLVGSGGADSIYGDIGSDLLKGLGGGDFLSGDAGNDTLLGGGSSGDRAYGGDGNDVVKGGSGSDLGYGGPGDDYLGGGSGVDTIFGDDGNDTLVGGRGADSLAGGDGSDVFVFNSYGDLGDAITDFEEFRDGAGDTLQISVDLYETITGVDGPVEFSVTLLEEERSDGFEPGDFVFDVSTGNLYLSGGSNFEDLSLIAVLPSGLIFNADNVILG